jgi:hypothetical protein
MECYTGVPLPFSLSRERKEEAKAPRSILKVEELRSENPQRRQKTRRGNGILFVIASEAKQSSF